MPRSIATYACNVCDKRFSEEDPNLDGPAAYQAALAHEAIPISGEDYQGVVIQVKGALGFAWVLYDEGAVNEDHVQVYAGISFRESTIHSSEDESVGGEFRKEWFDVKTIERFISEGSFERVPINLLDTLAKKLDPAFVGRHRLENLRTLEEKV